MTWEYKYNGENEKTTIYWNGDQIGSFEGRIKSFKQGFPTGEAREVIAQAIENAGTTERIRMQFDLNYGVSKRSDTE